MQEQEKKTGVDRRQHTRLHIIEYAVINRESEPVTSLPCLVVDIGLGGLQVRARNPIPPDTEVTFVVGKGGLVSTSFSAKTRYCTPVENSDLYAIGFKFMPTDTEERKSVVDFIHDSFHRQGETLLDP